MQQNKVYKKRTDNQFVNVYIEKFPFEVNNKDILPKERLDIKFVATDENKRVLILTPHGKKYEDLCEDVLWKLYL